MKLISWNVGHRIDVDAQVTALAGQKPDLVALQEVGRGTEFRLRELFPSVGLRFVEDSFHGYPRNKQPAARRYGEFIASRWPITKLSPEDIKMPWPERLLSVAVQSPVCEVELHSAYVPPGSSNGWIKVETLEGIYRRLARSCNSARILCGDLNTPRQEWIDGTVVTWGETIRKNGKIIPCLPGSKKEQKDRSERSVLLGLKEFDLFDVYRLIHEYGAQECSWFPVRKSGGVPRRYDHVFASRSLHPLSCKYLRDFRDAGLSDHAPIEVVFAPEQGLKLP